MNQEISAMKVSHDGVVVVGFKEGNMVVYDIRSGKIMKDI